MIFQQMTFEMMVFLNHLMLYLSTFGFAFAIHNAFIGLSSIKDLKMLTLIEVKAHKFVGHIGAGIFYILAAMCIYFSVLPRIYENEIEDFFYPTILWHTFVGGLIAFIMFSIKFSIARYKKDFIYKYGKIVGPVFGFGAYGLAYFTSNIDFFFWVNLEVGIPVPLLMPNYLISLILSILLGLILFTSVKAFKFKTYGKTESKNKLHGVAMILHGITFGYEGSAKDLVGTPVLYKYVFPKTYQFLERYAPQIGLDLNEMKKHNMNDAMEIAMKKFAEIGMAEKIKIEWISNNEFTIESINCSTAVVRSYMASSELVNSICPWAILAATIANAITGKDIEISPSEFNEIGAKSKLTLVEKEK